MIYEEYNDYTTKYKTMYGEQTIVLMEIGSFFEIYGVQNDVETTGADMSIAHNILNITVSRKNKNILENSNSNPLMAGFPSYQLKKYLDILVRHNFTIILVEQTTLPPNPKREVTQIISPSTYIEEIHSFSPQSLMVVYLESFKNSKNICIGLGCCVIELSTKNTVCFESINNFYSIEEEITRLCLSYNPKELVIISSSNDFDSLVFPKHIYTHNYLNSVDEKFLNKHTQQIILDKLFKNECGLLSPFEYLNMERNELICVAYTFMLDFVNSHNEKLLYKLTKPDILKNDQSLYISNDTLSQLDIFSTDTLKSKTLFNILNTCTSFIGKRFFLKRLTNPLTHVDCLNKSYNQIQEYIDHKYYQKTRPLLKKIYDIERIIRKTSISPINLFNLHSSLMNIKEVFQIVSYDPICDTILSFLNSTINFSKHENMTTILDKNVFNENIHTDIDELNNEYYKINSFFNNHEILKHHNLMKLEFSDKDGFMFTSTQKRVNDNKNLFDKYNSVKLKQNIVKIYNTEIDEQNYRLLEIKENIKVLFNRYYTIFIDEFLSKFGKTFDLIIQGIAEIDFYSANAYNAVQFNYCKPKIQESKDSFLQATQLRHPIIENIQKDIRYIPNNVEFNETQKGLILYGINASGKSSLMKSIGISVIMAQSGMYVAATDFKYYPFLNLHSRISNHDNMYKRQSTFTVEMSELRNILNCASNRSLIIGDELCSGTESISAISLVSAGIIQLAKLNANFIFATHLHELSNVREINKLKNVHIKHLSVSYCDKTNTIFYDRVLKIGAGDTLYGLEVCKSLDLGTDFLNIATHVRNTLLKKPHTLLKNKKSRYNSKVFKDICSICKNDADDIHHIKYQKHANENNMIESFHKNVEFNLVALCKKCHNLVHEGKIQIDEYIQTDKGIQLKYTATTTEEGII
jgi:DNA mismatch repair protein MutS